MNLAKISLPDTPEARDARSYQGHFSVTMELCDSQLQHDGRHSDYRETIFDTSLGDTNSRQWSYESRPLHELLSFERLPKPHPGNVTFCL